MAIWVDADACPNVIKEILFRAAERVQMPMTLVAKQNIRVPPSRFIRSLRVPAGFDVADNEIVRLCDAGDLVITADIPLAADVLAKGAAALNPRGPPPGCFVVQCDFHRLVIPYRFAVKLAQHLLQSFLYSLQLSGSKGNTWL